MAQDIYLDVTNLIEARCNKISDQIKKKQQQKFNKLLDDKLTKDSYNYMNQRRPGSLAKIVNLSNYQLTDKEENLLKFGLNYALPGSNPSNELIETGISIEALLYKSDIPDQDKENVRFQAAEIIQQSHDKLAKNPIRKWDDWIINAIKTIKSNKNIIITKADKGNSTVILNRIDYDNKILDHLNSGPYKLLENEREFKESIKELNSLINQLNLDNKLNETQFEYLSAKQKGNQHLPIFYGVPKIHKENTPFRPIVDYRSSPFYNTAHFLNKIL